MTKTTNRSNLNRKVRAILAKTEAAGCENGEAAAALERAHKLVKQHGLNRDLFEWPNLPKGWKWDGDDVVRATEKPAKAKRKAKGRADGRKRIVSATPRAGTKSAVMLDLMKRRSGATAQELMDATGWQPHTVRGHMSHLRKAGVNIETKREAGITSYRIVS